jgi:hypothetical protein
MFQKKKKKKKDKLSSAHGKARYPGSYLPVGFLMNA